MKKIDSEKNIYWKKYIDSEKNRQLETIELVKKKIEKIQTEKKYIEEKKQSEKKIDSGI